MTNELKVGDRVTVNGEEWIVMNQVCSGSGEPSFVFTKTPQKSELEKFLDSFCQRDRRPAREGALALLEYLEIWVDRSGGGYGTRLNGMCDVLHVARKWCGN